MAGKKREADPAAEAAPRKAKTALLLCLLFAAVAQVLSAAASAAAIRNLDAAARLAGDLFSVDADTVETLADIFAPLRTADIKPRVPLPFCACCAGFLLFLAAKRLSGRKARWKYAAVPLILLAGILLVLVSFALTLWMTDVNGIRFGDAMRSLWKTLRSGAMDSLTLIPKEAPVWL